MKTQKEPGKKVEEIGNLFINHVSTTYRLLYSVLLGITIVYKKNEKGPIANEQAERRREAGEAAAL